MDDYGFDNSGPLMVLVVEDEEEHAEITRRMISSITDLRVEVTVVGLLREAKELLRMKHYHVILLDLELPNGRGLNTLREVMSVPSVPPIIVLTGAESEPDAIAAIRTVGAQSYIPKGKLTNENIRRILLYAIAREQYATSRMDSHRKLYADQLAALRVENEELKRRVVEAVREPPK